MKIGGLQKFTLIDYPGKLACTIFFSGCNFRCPWCYSPELVLPEKIEGHPEIKEEDFFDFLEKRKGKLDGVVLCGGEPTIYQELPIFISKIKEMGFLVKLDTNGTNPEMINKLISSRLIDYIAMDVKSSLENYKKAVSVDIDKEIIEGSVRLIIDSGVDYEFRTTVVPGIHSKDDIEKIGELIKGAKRYFIQNFFPEKTIDSDFLKKKPFSKEELEEFEEIAASFVEKCETR